MEQEIIFQNVIQMDFKKGFGLGRILWCEGIQLRTFVNAVKNHLGQSFRDSVKNYFVDQLVT
jgi:hypothetical protein